MLVTKKRKADKLDRTSGFISLCKNMKLRLERWEGGHAT